MAKPTSTSAPAPAAPAPAAPAPNAPATPAKAEAPAPSPAPSPRGAGAPERDLRATPTPPEAATSDTLAALLAASTPTPPTPPDSPEAEAVRRRVPRELRHLAPEILVAIETAMNEVPVALESGDPLAFAAALRKAADAVEAAVRGGGVTAKVPADSHEEAITIPGEGTFIVVVNGKGRVELRAALAISGTGLQQGDRFAKDPTTAVRLVLAGGATPVVPGGVRRAKGTPAGESGASA